jgi:hypothetical protein
MITKRAAKLSIPPVTLVLAYLLAFIAAHFGRYAFLAVHFPLEIVIVGSLLASVILSIRLFQERKSAEVRLPLVLNALAVGWLFVMLLMSIVVKNSKI